MNDAIDGFPVFSPRIGKVYFIDERFEPDSIRFIQRKISSVEPIKVF
jgi:hypothetical protein